MSSDLQSSEVSDTSVGSDLFQSLEVFSQLGLQGIGSKVEPGSVLKVILSVHEPFGDSIADGVGDDVLHHLAILFSEFAGSTVGIDSCDFADQVGESSTDSLYCS